MSRPSAPRTPSLPTSLGARPLRWNAAIQVQRFDGATTTDHLLCEIPRPDGGIDRYALPAPIVSLAQRFDGTRTTLDVMREAATPRLSGDAPGAGRAASDENPTIERYQRLVNKVFVPRGFLVLADGSWVGAPPRRRRSYLYVRLPLLAAPWVHPAARALGGLFRPPGRVLALLLIVTSQLWFFLALRPTHPLALKGLVGGTALWVVLLVSLGSLVHEFGHAAAAVRYGCRNVAIGFGVYLYYFVLYTDLSEAWRLRRSQRAVVDVGGVYLQALFVAGVLGAYFAFRWEPLLYVTLFTNAAMVSYVSPFLRLDGYWLVADLFGIANLRERSLAVARLLWLRLRHGRCVPAPALGWTLNAGATVALSVYAAASAAFVVWLWVELVRHFGVGFLSEYAGAWRRLVPAVTHPAVLSILVALFDILWRTSALIGLAMFIWRGIRMILGTLRRLQSRAGDGWSVVRPAQMAHPAGSTG